MRSLGTVQVGKTDTPNATSLFCPSFIHSTDSYSGQVRHWAWGHRGEGRGSHLREHIGTARALERGGLWGSHPPLSPQKDLCMHSPKLQCPGPFLLGN